jgi:hypothetical protein
LNRFADVLFDEGELTCIGSLYETALRPALLMDQVHPYFSINPMRERRADSNVTCYRNILFECDRMDLTEQRERTLSSGIPFTTQVYSGGKSFHFIISLAQPCKDRADYNKLVQRIYRALKASAGLDVDRACRNPARFSRVPGHRRDATGHIQELIYTGERVQREILESWLDSHCPPERPRAEPYKGRWLTVPSGFTLNFLMTGRASGSRHNALVCAACELRDSGETEDDVLSKLFRVPGIFEERNGRAVTESEIEGVVRWAFSQAE